MIRRRTDYPYGLELTRFLLQDNAVMQAESELISISSILPKNPELHLQVAELFLQARDFERALAEYENVLRVEPTNTEALLGAGYAAFQLRRYRDVENNLSRHRRWTLARTGRPFAADRCNNGLGAWPCIFHASACAYSLR